MASLRELRRRIKSVQNIHGITKAMEIISAVRYKKIEKRFKSASPYFDTLDRLVGRIVTDELCAHHPFFEKRDVRKELILMVTGSRGLCGSFNSAVAKELQKYRARHPDREIVLYPIGKVGAAYVKKREIPTLDSWIDFGFEFTMDDVNPLTETLIKLYEDNEFQAINILSTEMPRSGVYTVGVSPFLSLRHLMDRGDEEKSAAVDYIFEPSKEATFEKLINLYVKQTLFMSLLKSVTAEYFARMMAMKQATDNGKEMISTLTLKRNKVRQAMITNELSEIIGGANALN